MLLRSKPRIANWLPVLLASFASLASLPFPADAQRWYPNVGEVRYDGYAIVDFWFMW